MISPHRRVLVGRLVVINLVDVKAIWLVIDQT